MPMLRLLTAVFFLLLTGLIPGWSQTGPGAIHGQVTDPAGRSIPGAVVTLSNGRGSSRSAATDAHGEYRVANLPLGTYTIRVSAKGFAAVDRHEIEITSAAARVLDFPLSLAPARESVTVADSAHVQVDPSANGDALVLRGSDLD